ncbi:beclin 1-associated autophagy-related key regulator [Copidosoma floridanum]|uniref:beclin 1-associated autophagy-related key regulator n=1 Tax=Copidosoma floridanum TaxID=29053 RepID=UPI0006C999C9|nr:beclin 1-associated autophagy-related key regulator [Copidosoma floridanum]
MAGSSSSERSSCLPPTDFQLSVEDAEDDDDDERLAINLLKCPLCHNGRKSFYCKQCVHRGDFVHSSSVYSERYKPSCALDTRFIEKQQRFLRLKAARNQLEERCTKALEKHRQRDKLICDINACKERVKILKHMETKARQNIADGQQQLKVLKEINAKITSRLPKHEVQTEKLIKYSLDIKFKWQQQRDAFEKKKQQIKTHAREIAKQLIKYIFPLSRVEPSDRSSNSSEESISDSTDLLTYALADASGTSYVRGKWVNDTDNVYKFYKNIENNSQVKYRIVHPTLPGSGDYSAYSRWEARNKDEPINKENMMHNPARNITAALAYATQLVNILAYYLNVRLPYKMMYKEFYDNDMPDDQFIGKVARLNSNILYLCLTQNTDPTVLQPRHTLQNLMNLLDVEVTDLGRTGAIETDPTIVAHLFNDLAPDLEKYCSASSPDEDDDLDIGWEAVPHVDCPEVTIPIPRAAMSRQHSSNIQVNQSVAGGLVTSAAASIVSMWRGWTNK